MKKSAIPKLSAAFLAGLTGCGSPRWRICRADCPHREPARAEGGCSTRNTRYTLRPDLDAWTRRRGVCRVAGLEGVPERPAAPTVRPGGGPGEGLPTDAGQTGAPSRHEGGGLGVFHEHKPRALFRPARSSRCARRMVGADRQVPPARLWLGGVAAPPGLPPRNARRAVRGLRWPPAGPSRRPPSCRRQHPGQARFANLSSCARQRACRQRGSMLPARPSGFPNKKSARIDRHVLTADAAAFPWARTVWKDCPALISRLPAFRPLATFIP